MQVQIDLILEAAQRCACQALVLSAFGFGAYGNPLEAAAAIFKEALHRRVGHLIKVVFCMLDDHSAGRRHNPRGNFQPLTE